MRKSVQNITLVRASPLPRAPKMIHRGQGLIGSPSPQCMRPSVSHASFIPYGVAECVAPDAHSSLPGPSAYTPLHDWLTNWAISLFDCMSYRPESRVVSEVDAGYGGNTHIRKTHAQQLCSFPYSVFQWSVSLVMQITQYYVNKTRSFFISLL